MEGADPNATLAGPPPGENTDAKGESGDPAWATVQALAGTMHGFEGRPSTTLERGDVTGGGQLLGLLSKDRSQGLVVRETLGEGGMGLVRRALQPTLGREVAVKSIRPGRRDDNSLAKILQEAWVLGRLDHPNIVPIHDITLDDEGIPRIVMKRIEGEAWCDLFDKQEVIADRFGVDPLEWNLRVMLQVCNALAYAHAKGILHLDIKPENVMIGAFGEVYLMDWGIAMTLEPDPEGRLPAAAHCNQVLGTPCYIAPEMLEADGERLGVHTDVYLVGATLYELIDGKPPHRGDSMMNMLHDVVQRDPKLGVECPAALTELVHRCLDRDTEARPTSVTEVRDALAEVLTQRDAERLCDTADERGTQLRVAISSDQADSRTVYDHFAACRFGYGAALERNPDSARAREGLRGLSVAMIEWELDKGRPAAAAAIAESTNALEQALRERIDTALADERARAAKLAALEHDQDVTIGQRTRLFIIAVLGTIWSVLPVYGHFYAAKATLQSPAGFFYLSAGFLALVVAFGVWARESMTKTAFNRRMGGMLVALFVAQSGLAALGWRLEFGIYNTQIMSFFLYMATAAFTSIFSDKRFWVTAAAYAIATVVAVLAGPEAGRPLLVLAAANLVFTLNVAWVWRMPLAEMRRPRRQAQSADDAAPPSSV